MKSFPREIRCYLQCSFERVEISWRSGTQIWGLRKKYESNKEGIFSKQLQKKVEESENGTHRNVKSLAANSWLFGKISYIEIELYFFPSL